MPTSESRPSERVVRAVAAYSDADPLELRPLQEVIDAEALDALFEPTARRQQLAPGHVRFVYEDREVTVFSDGSVDVSEPQAVPSEQEPSRSEADVR